MNDLLRSTSNREEIHIEKAADQLDELQLQMNRELAIRNLHLSSALLRNVNGALKRLDKGTFGICQQCDEPIPEKRLNALPWAAYCIPCQEEVDRRRASGDFEDAGVENE